MNETWDLIRSAIEVVGMIFIPIVGWVLLTVVKHGSKLVMLEEKVNDAITRRLDSLENKVDGIEIKIDNKMDKLEDSLHETQIQIAAGLSKDINTVLDVLNKQE